MTKKICLNQESFCTTRCYTEEYVKGLLKQIKNLRSEEHIRYTNVGGVTLLNMQGELTIAFQNLDCAEVIIINKNSLECKRCISSK